VADFEQEVFDLGAEGEATRAVVRDRRARLYAGASGSGGEG
jgi:hypothetical protein